MPRVRRQYSIDNSLDIGIINDDVGRLSSLGHRSTG